MLGEQPVVGPVFAGNGEEGVVVSHELKSVGTNQSVAPFIGHGGCGHLSFFRLVAFALCIVEQPVPSGLVGIAGFLQNRQEEPFASGQMRHEAVSRHARHECGSYSPGRVCVDGERGGSQPVHQVEYHLLVLLGVVGAGAVNEQTSRAQGLPHVVENLALAVGTAGHTGGRPLGNGGGVFAEHALARAGDIGGNDVEIGFEAGKVGRLVAGDNRVGRAPFHDILGQDIGPVGDYLVAYHQTAGRQRGDGVGRLAAGSGAEVEVTYRGLYVLGDDPAEKHRRGLLHVVGPGVKTGVEGEGGAFGQVIALCRPGNRLTQHLCRVALARIEA